MTQTLGIEKVDKADSFIRGTGQTFVPCSQDSIGSQVARHDASFSQWFAPLPNPASVFSLVAGRF